MSDQNDIIREQIVRSLLTSGRLQNIISVEKNDNIEDVYKELYRQQIELQKEKIRFEQEKLTYLQSKITDFTEDDELDY